MTPQEYELFKAKARALAFEALNVYLSNFLMAHIAGLKEPERTRSIEALKRKMELTRKDYSSMAIPGEDPAISDLKCAEFQEVFDELSKQLVEQVVSRTVRD